MKLPSIVITGTQQELIEIEPLLVLIGYNKPDEDWNNLMCISNYLRSIITYRDNSLDYHVHYGLRKRRIFKATNTKGIINYIEKYSELPTHSKADGIGFGGHRLA